MNSFDAEMRANRKVTPAFNRDTEVGYEVDGYLTEEVVVRELTDLITRNIRRFDNGDPMTQYIATIQTDLNEYDGDDGLRRIFIKGVNKKTFREAVRSAGANTTAIGGRLRARYTGQDATSNAKLYAFEYSKPQIEQMKLWDDVNELETKVNPTYNKRVKAPGAAA